MRPDPGRVATLLQRYEDASGAELHAGRGWYDGEARVIRAMAPPEVDPDRALVATAVLSPRTRWETLLDALGPWLHGERTTLPAYTKAIERAERILVGDEWIPEFGRSPKINSFSRALLGDTDAVTIDIWMLRALGWTKETLTLREYEALSRDVRAAAALAGETPREFQAVVWTKERGVKEL